MLFFSDLYWRLSSWKIIGKRNLHDPYLCLSSKDFFFFFFFLHRIPYTHLKGSQLVFRESCRSETHVSFLHSPGNICEMGRDRYWLRWLTATCWMLLLGNWVTLTARLKIRRRFCCQHSKPTTLIVLAWRASEPWWCWLQLTSGYDYPRYISSF